MMPRARLLAVNHVAVEVGEAEEAFDFYGRIYEVELRGGGPRMAFIDAGDQFIASPRAGWNRPTSTPHIGLVVDGKRAVRRAPWMGVEILSGRGLDFLDPWGNRWQVVEFAEIQFTKAPEVLRDSLGDLKKAEKAPE